ncbi:MAG: prepilin peptidase [Rhizobiales bacterium]|nr:prepilin peptidase [Hyphomicrobiales bacterium]
MDGLLAHLTFAFFALLMLYAAVSDLGSYTLPNHISVILIVGFLCVMALIQPPLSVFAWHFGVALLVFAVGFALFAFGILGGGDVKVVSALALWLGPNDFLNFFTLMAIFGGILALFLLIFRRLPVSEKWLKNNAIKGLHDRNEGIPYGVAIAAAMLIILPKTDIYGAIQAL